MMRTGPPGLLVKLETSSASVPGRRHGQPDDGFSSNRSVSSNWTDYLFAASFDNPTQQGLDLQYDIAEQMPAEDSLLNLDPCGRRKDRHFFLGGLSWLFS